ncbi:MAG: UPF0149 family protein [Candidatus Eremiobacteraeota bacterium]|nr:UPF0149 family protein [Candidatus Eremiobacteraeota bacterium]
MKTRDRLSNREHNKLESLMELRNPDGPLDASISRLHGFLMCVVSGPMIMPSEWIPTVFGKNESDGSAWENIDKARNAMTLLMRFYNEICTDLAPGGRPSILIDRIGDPPDAFDLAIDWCRGYMVGVSMRADEWKEATVDPELARFFDPIAAQASTEESGVHPINEPEKYAELLDFLPECAVGIYDWFRGKLVASMQAQSATPSGSTVRRAKPKVSPNAPCECGSGKKYKRCCSPLQVV